MRDRQRRYFDAGRAGCFQKCAGAAPRIVQHRLDGVGGEGVGRLARQVSFRNHPVSGVGDDGKTALAELPRKIAGQISTGQIKQRTCLLQHLRSYAGHNALAQARGIDVSEIAMERGGPLRRLAGMVQLIDYASVYLGIASGIDPLAIAAIKDLRDLTGRE